MPDQSPTFATIRSVEEPGTGRLEAFGDGVFALAATLLVLELAAGSGGDLGSELRPPAALFSRA